MRIAEALVGAVKLVQSVTKETTDESEYRLAVCRQCSKSTGWRCQLCGCVLTAKVKHPNEKCPIGRW